MKLKPIKMTFKLKKLVILFIFLIILYAIYFLVLNRTFLKLGEFNYEPINYRNFAQMNRLKKNSELLNRIKSEKLSLNKLKLNKLYKEVDCLINDEFNINCLKSLINQEIYLPFNSFIKHYFDVYGYLDNQSNEREIFHFEHSYSKIYTPTSKYDVRKKFLWFENYNVDNRDRVKYISGLYNVPISSQWTKSRTENGHYYPIQISQFGLSHFNKYLQYGDPKFIYLDLDRYVMKIDKSNDELKINLKSNDIDSTNTMNSTINLQTNLTIDQITLDNIETTNDQNISSSITLESVKILKKRRAIRIKDKLNEATNSNEQNSDEKASEEVNFYNNDNSIKNRTIYLNNNKLILQLNLTKKSSFYNSLFLSFKYKLIKDLKIIVTLINEKQNKFKINYRSINNDIFKDNLIYGIGNDTINEWKLFTRNLGIDLIKSISLFRRKNIINLKLKNLHLFSVQFSGDVYLKDIKLNSHGHFYNFANAVNWLIKFQDENGGWRSKINKRLVSNNLILNNNWPSSMAQGQGMSLLIRMFHYINQFNLINDQVELKNHNMINNFKNLSSTYEIKINDELIKLRNNLNDSKLYADNDNLILNNSLFYLNAAIQAANLFKVNVSDNGICTYLFNLKFYEEYPTKPSLFVLNGFIYSLFGLYDVKTTIDLLISNHKFEKSLDDFYLTKFNEINELFNNGIKSLKTLLPLYDTGSSSLYDLRHFSLNVPPVIARWSYHATHINQLLYLNTILNDKNIDNIILRWIGYMKGKKSAHN